MFPMSVNWKFVSRLAACSATTFDRVDSLSKWSTNMWRTCWSSEFTFISTRTRWRDHLRISNSSDEQFDSIINKVNDGTISISRDKNPFKPRRNSRSSSVNLSTLIKSPSSTMSKSTGRTKDNSPGQKNSTALRRTPLSPPRIRCPRSMDISNLFTGAFARQEDREKIGKEILPFDLSNASIVSLGSVPERLLRLWMWLCCARRSSLTLVGLSMFLVERFSVVLSRSVDLVRIISNDFSRRVKVNRLRQSLDHRMIDMKEIEVVLPLSRRTSHPSLDTRALPRQCSSANQHCNDVSNRRGNGSSRRSPMPVNTNKNKTTNEVEWVEQSDWIAHRSESMRRTIDGIETISCPTLKWTDWMPLPLFNSSVRRRHPSFEVRRMRFIWCFSVCSPFFSR